MDDGKKEKGLSSTTSWLMIGTALFFDAVQFLLSFVYMGWLMGVFAGLTFWLWFRFHGISFMKPKRLLTFGGASLIEILPIPFLAALPAWTAAVVILVLDSKLKKVAPGLDIIKK